jgi:hypothetical protein
MTMFPIDPYSDVPETDPGYERANRHRPNDPRRSSEYKLLQRSFRDECRMQRNPDGSYGAPCWRCHRPIDYRLRWPHPQAFELDHALTVKDRPDLALTRSNFKPAHAICNKRGNGDQDADDLDIGEPSECW